MDSVKVSKRQCSAEGGVSVRAPLSQAGRWLLREEGQAEEHTLVISDEPKNPLCDSTGLSSVLSLACHTTGRVPYHRLEDSHPVGQRTHK